MSTKMGFSVTMVLLCSAWWSMMPTMLLMGIDRVELRLLLEIHQSRNFAKSRLSRSSSTANGEAPLQVLSANSVSVLISDFFLRVTAVQVRSADGARDGVQVGHDVAHERRAGTFGHERKRF